MKSLWRIAKPVPANLPFSHRDIHNAIFSPDPLTLEDRPFVSLHPAEIANVPILYRIALQEDSSIEIVDLLKRSILRVGKREVRDPELLLRLPPHLFNMLITRYLELTELWYRYMNQEIEQFCQAKESKLQWILCRQLGIAQVLPMPLRSEQKAWILLSDQLTRNSDRQFMLDVRDSLLPWLNLDLYREYEKTKDSRKNVLYEQQHRAMVDGTFASEELDIIE